MTTHLNETPEPLAQEQAGEMPVVAWMKVDKKHIPSMRMLSEAYVQGVWDVELVRLSDATAALQAKDAEIARLKADAGRYRWLRHGDNDEKVLMIYEANCSRPFDHRYDQAWLPRNEALDAAIDSAREKNHG